MSNQLRVSLIIGAFLGGTIAVSSFLPSNFGLILSVVSCVVAGIVTVIKIDNKPHLYAMPACFLSAVIVFITYGLENGVVYSLLVVFLYGIISVQLCIALANSFDNVKFLIEKMKGKR